MICFAIESSEVFVSTALSGPYGVVKAVRLIAQRPATQCKYNKDDLSAAIVRNGRGESHGESPQE